MRILVVGHGRMGQHHARVSRESGHDVVAVLDPVAEATGLPLVRTWDEAPAADLAIVATPTRFHEEAALEAIRRGMHVLIEKPLAPDVAACDRILRAASDAGVLVAVGHVERFNAAVLAYRPEGVVRHVATRRWSPRPTRIQDVGCTMDIGIHDLDLCRSLLGDLDVTASQRTGGPLDDSMQALMRSASGTASVDVSWLADAPRRELVVVEEGRTVHLDLQSPTITTRDGATACPDAPGQTALHRQLADVVAAIAQGRAPTVDGAAGRAAVALTQAILS